MPGVKNHKNSFEKEEQSWKPYSAKYQDLFSKATTFKTVLYWYKDTQTD